MGLYLLIHSLGLILLDYSAPNGNVPKEDGPYSSVKNQTKG